MAQNKNVLSPLCPEKILTINHFREITTRIRPHAKKKKQRNAACIPGYGGKTAVHAVQQTELLLQNVVGATTFAKIKRAALDF